MQVPHANQGPGQDFDGPGLIVDDQNLWCWCHVLASFAVSLVPSVTTMTKHRLSPSTDGGENFMDDTMA
jgi:hypothetical protein